MSRRTGRYLLASSLVLAVGIPSVALATGEGNPLLLGKRNPSPNGSLAVSAETEIIADNSSYGTRQSNKRDGDGGGAIYGCRSNPGAEPCIRANNLKGGRAFELATVGREAGRITVGDPAGAPLTTNATGVATGFNADRVDGREGADLASAGDLKFAVVGADGTLGARRGATSATGPSAERTFVVTFDADVSRCSYTAAPVGNSTAEALGVATGSDPRTVIVDQADALTTAHAFHLQVIC